MPAKIHPTAIVEDGAQLADGVEIGPYAVVRAGVRIGAGTVLGPRCVVEGEARIGRGNSFGVGVLIGLAPQDLKYHGEPSSVEIGDGNVVREYTSIHRGTGGGGRLTKIGDGNLIMGYCHVAHDCVIGNKCVFANLTTFGGHVVVEDAVVTGGLVGFHHFVRIGRFAMVGGCSKISRDVPPYTLVDGNPASVRGINAVGLRRKGFDEETRQALARAVKELFNSGRNVSNVVREIRAAGPVCPELEHLLSFVEAVRDGRSGRALDRRQ